MNTHEIEKRIREMRTKQDALAIYRQLFSKPLTIAAFMKWAGYTRQAWYTWPDKLADPVRLMLKARFAERLEEEA